VGFAADGGGAAGATAAGSTGAADGGGVGGFGFEAALAVVAAFAGLAGFVLVADFGVVAGSGAVTAFGVATGFDVLALFDGFAGFAVAGFVVAGFAVAVGLGLTALLALDAVAGVRVGFAFVEAAAFELGRAPGARSTSLAALVFAGCVVPSLGAALPFASTSCSVDAPFGSLARTAGGSAFCPQAALPQAHTQHTIHARIMATPCCRCERRCAQPSASCRARASRCVRCDSR
jgi:hypothetical protein